MTETPYALLLKRQRDRKSKIAVNIQSKDLKHRSISYNLKISSDSGQDPEECKPKEKMRMSFASSIKKSYVTRKFLNRTAEGMATCEDYCRFKQQINKGARHEGFDDKKPRFLKDFLEKEQQSKFLEKRAKEDGLQIIICSKQSEKQSKNVLPPPMLISKKSAEEKAEKIQNISDIAERRKMSLDFDLQIHGNKKRIKVKEGLVSKPTTKKREYIENICDCDDTLLGDRCLKCFPKQISLHEPNQNLRPPCTFFRRMQEHYTPECSEQSNFNFKITKLKHNIGQLPDLNFEGDWVFGRSNTTDHPPNAQFVRSIDTPFQIRREIKSSWNHAGGDRRYAKLQTAEEKRYTMRKNNKPTTNFANDIKGWNVKNEQQEDDEQFFARK